MQLPRFQALEVSLYILGKNVLLGKDSLNSFPRESMRLRLNFSVICLKIEFKNNQTFLLISVTFTIAPMNIVLFGVL